ncbi:MAG: cobalamin B12-binding domain protein [Mucilaginibacter sp.]|nr:cobalamin B12-binding domain protein [Mucilaginibacter sp.]
MHAGLNIAALAHRTGVAPDTLRKWEQRYSILQPSRTTGGQRRYSERDVARVEWLRERLSEGYRIGEAATLLGSSSSTSETAHSPAELVRGILHALEHGDAGDIGLYLDQAFALNSVEATLAKVLGPLLETVGDRWQAGELNIADEHLVSESVRSRLGHLLSDTGGGVRGVAVLACAPGERHELGLMMAAIALRRDGWDAVYLGSDTPAGAAVTLAERLSARVLGVSVSAAESGAALEEALRDVPRPEGLELVVGGGGASARLAKRLSASLAPRDLPAAVGALRAFAA